MYLSQAGKVDKFWANSTNNSAKGETILKAESVKEQIGFSFLNPFHGCYVTNLL